MATDEPPTVITVSASAPELRNVAKVPVIIIGAGACGLVAALRLRDQGIEPLIIERDKHPCGSTALSSGFIPACGSLAQAAAGISDSPQLLAKDIQHKAADQADPLLVTAYCNAIGPAMDWLQTSHDLPFEVLDGFLYPGHSVRRMHAVPERTGQALIDRLWQATSLASIDVLFDARVDQILALVDGHPVGIRLVRPNGSHETIACDQLLFACNGYGGNPDLVAQWLPAMSQAVYAGHAGNDGSAVSWGEQLGAALADMGGYQGHGSWAVPHGILISWALMMRGGIQINTHGRRFHDETTGYSEAAVQVLSQPSRQAWNLFAQQDLPFAREFPDFKQAEQAGALKFADTTAELAALIGCEASNLEQTLGEIAVSANEQCVDVFGRQFERALAVPLAAVKVTGALFHTQGGLAVNAAMAVCRADGSPLPNCYAAGGAARGVSGNTVAGYLSGNGLLSAIAGGFIAANSISQVIKP